MLYSSLFFALIMALIAVSKPAALFDPETGRPRPFGSSPGATLFSLGVVAVVAAVLSLYTFAMIDLASATRPSYPQV